MTVLLTGGAGYIGSHTAVELLNAGHDVVIADNYANSSSIVAQRITRITGKPVKCYEADAADPAALERIFQENAIDSVIHFAGLKAVGESVRLPLDYYRNNLDSTLALLAAMEAHGVRQLIFSSSATVYGRHAALPYREDAETGPCTNPYGWTKLFIEQIIRDYAAAHPDFSVVLLRYFNPVGAHESGLMGEDPRDIPNNLMPYIARVAVGTLPYLNVFGNDYPRRHRRPGLYPCHRSGHRPYGRPGLRRVPHRRGGVQPGHRHRLQRAGHGTRLLPRLRQGHPLPHRAPPQRRYRRLLCRRHQGQKNFGLARQAGHRRHVPQRLELAEPQPQRLRRLITA